MLLLVEMPPGAWLQDYTPYGLPLWVSAPLAALPIALLFYLLGIRRVAAPIAALAGAVATLLVAVLLVRMPPGLAAASFVLGAASGLVPIAWVVFAAFLLYQIAVDTGQFEALKSSVGRLTGDRRLQAILIAFSFSAVLEGSAGFGIPVAISAALLVGLGFRPFPAAVLCLLGNTAPVAWGAIGTPLVALAKVSDLPLHDLSTMNARILPLVSCIVPLWLVRTMVPWRETWEVLPGALVSGLSFAATQLLWGSFGPPGLVDIASGLVSLLALAAFLLVWRPRRVWRFPEESADGPPAEPRPIPAAAPAPGSVSPAGWRPALRAWTPFIALFAAVVLSSVLQNVPAVNGLQAGPLRAKYSIEAPFLSGKVWRARPVVPVERPEAAVYDIRPLFETGTAVFAASLVTSLLLRQGRRGFAASFLAACRRMRAPFLTILPMVGIGFVTRYSGLDAILGQACAKTGVLFPFFGTFLGWLGVAITGSDTSSNFLFGSLQKITSGGLGLNPVLMCSANAAGGSVGKMVNAQSIVVATAATGQQGSEGRLFAAVFVPSIAMTALVAAIVAAYAYLFPGAIPGVPAAAGGP